MTETILPPDANRTETYLISKGSAPRVSLDEESDYERRIRVWTSQGYPRHDAVWRIELQDQMVAG